MNRIKDVSFPREGHESRILPYTHVLDLADFGFIKPHIDSSRVGLTTDNINYFAHLDMSVLRLHRGCGESAGPLRGEVQTGRGQGPVCGCPHQAEVALHHEVRRKRSHLAPTYTSAYRGFSRYKCTHEVLHNDESFFNGEAVKKTRRVSIICRNEA